MLHRTLCHPLSSVYIIDTVSGDCVLAAHCVLRKRLIDLSELQDMRLLQASYSFLFSIFLFFSFFSVPQQAEVKGVVMSVAKKDVPGVIRASFQGDIGCVVEQPTCPLNDAISVSVTTCFLYLSNIP